ncbi:MAG: GDSL-type esterase/lipase family protein [Candidatus Woesearchaeota archaeon]|jgi:lysophospholipase L1-like esterase
MKKFKQKLMALSLGTVIAVLATPIIGETYLRVKTKDVNTNPFAHNPVIEAQTSEQTFFPDPILGHRLTPPFADIFNKDYNFQKTEQERTIHEILPSSFIGISEKRIQTIDEVVASLNQSQPIVLNLGDSSTSGWDSNVVSSNRVKRKYEARGKNVYESPFFNYETYPNLLAKEGFAVINAGVPGFTSIQGERYIKRLFDEFEQKGIYPTYVTIYFGNNEGVWNGNTQDKYVLPQEHFTLLFPGIIKTSLSNFVIYPRVNVEEYKQNIQRIIETIQEHNATPLLIKPLIPKYWHPGLRAEQGNGEAEVWQMMYDNKETKAISDLETAIQIYKDAERTLVTAGNDEQRKHAKALFITAQNLDYVVPRIKPDYVKALYEIAIQLRIPIIDVQDHIPIDDRKYFGDYCHPIEPANRLIAEEIKKNIKESN